MTASGASLSPPPDLRAILDSLAISAQDVHTGIFAFRSNAPTIWAQQFVTETTAMKLWREWNPDDAGLLDESGFRLALRDLLRDGIALGISLNRFRKLASRLLPWGRGAMAWIEQFEDIVAQLGPGELRIFLSPKEYVEYNRDIRSTAESTWQQLLDAMMDELFYELGVTFPPPTVLSDERLTGSECRCEWNDLALPARPGLRAGLLLVNDTVDRLTLLGVTGEQATAHSNGSRWSIVDISHRDACERAGLSTWDPRGCAVLEIAAALRSAAPAFVTRSLLELYLFRLADFDPDLVGIVEKKASRDVLVQVLRGLIAESISIRHLVQILNWYVKQESTFTIDHHKYIVFSISEGIYLHRAQKEVSVGNLVGMSRSVLARYISHKFARGRGTLVVYLIDPEIENRLANPEELSATERRVILEAVREEIGEISSAHQDAVILTTMDIRHRLHALIEPAFSTTVLAYQELSADMNIQPISRISAEGLKHCRLLETFEMVVGAAVGEEKPPTPPNKNSRTSLGRWLAVNGAEVVAEAGSAIATRRHGFSHTADSAAGLERILREIVFGSEHPAASKRQLEALGTQLGKAALTTGLMPDELLEVLFSVSAVARRHIARDLSSSGEEDALDRFKQWLESIDAAVQGTLHKAIEAAGL